MVSIHEVKIEGIRGIPGTQGYRGLTQIHPGSRGLIIFGENGSGKSSITDAFEYFFSNSLQYINDVLSLSFNECFPHCDSRVEDCSVKIDFSVNTNNLELTRTNSISPSSSDPALVEYLNHAKDCTTILRRAKLLEFINSQPAKRYKVIASFMGITGLDERQLAVKSLRNNLSNELQRYKDELEEKRNELEFIYGSRTKADILAKLNDELAKVLPPEQQSIEEISRVTKKWLTEHAAVLKQENCLEHLESTQAPLQELVNSTQSLDQLLGSISEKEPKKDLINLLRSGLLVVRDQTENICPLCLSEKDLQELTKSIVERTIGFRKITEKYDLLDSIREKRQQSLIRTRGILVNATNAISSLSFSHKIEVDALSKYEHEVNTTIVDSLKLDRAEYLKQTASSLYKTLKRAFSRSSTPPLEIAIGNVSWRAESVLSNFRTQSGLEDKVAKYETALSQADLIYETYVEKSKEVVRQYFNLMINDLQRYFGRLHPNEPHSNIQLDLRPNVRASTEILMDSFDLIGKDPRAFCSEGHLDSLGLCIFLAFVKNFRSDCKFIILDDVVTTIDSNHRGKLADLLLDEFDDYQLFIMTHDSVWLETLNRKILARGIQNDFPMMKIRSWSRTTGPVLVEYKNNRQQIEESLTNGDYPSAAIQSGIYLERVLKNACEDLEVMVKYKKDVGRFQTSTLLGMVRSDITSRLPRTHIIPQEITRALIGVEGTMFWRNYLAHDVAISPQVTSGDVQDFWDAVNELKRVLVCRDVDCVSRLKVRGTEFRCLSQGCTSPTIVQM